MKVSMGRFRKNGKRKIKVSVSRQDCWNADHTIAVMAYPLLKKFKKQSFGSPAEMTKEKWNKILDKMIWSMKMMAEEKDYCPASRDVRSFYRRLDRGFSLFGKYFRNLWY